MSPGRWDVVSSPHRVASLLRPQSRTEAWQRCLGVVCRRLHFGRRRRSRFVHGGSRWAERRGNQLCGRRWFRVRAGQLIAWAQLRAQDHPCIGAAAHTLARNSASRSRSLLPPSRSSDSSTRWRDADGHGVFLVIRRWPPLRARNGTARCSPVPHARAAPRELPTPAVRRAEPGAPS